MQKFQDLLTEAAQLKQQQLKNERKNFQALPEYLKSGLNYAKKYIQLRKQNYLVQKYVSQKVKTLGNDNYLLQNYGEALSKYQQALSVFRYIHATKYENLKDEDILYQNYIADKQNHQSHNTHLVALYLNICSALTKMNKKDQAIHASEQAFKLNQTNAKIYYKRAQAYLQYINKDSSDVKLGFYYLNKAYQISKDNSILVQMHKIKKQLDQQRQKQKSWFKFMFDKNKQTQDPTEKKDIQLIKQPLKQVGDQNPQSKTIKDQTIKQKLSKEQTKQSKQAIKQIKQRKQRKPKIEQKPKQVKLNVGQKSRFNSQIKQLIEQAKKMPQSHQDNSSQLSQRQMRNKKYQQQLQRFKQQNKVQKSSLTKEQQQKHEKTKQNLKKYLIVPRDDRWLIKYQEDFIHKNGSKIYNMLQLCNYKDYLLEFKSILAKCLDLKQTTITVNKDQNQILKQKIQNYGKFIEWLKAHPIQKYLKYIQRYNLQVRWIQQNRGRPLDQIYTKKQQHQNNSDNKTHKLTQRLTTTKKQAQIKAQRQQQKESVAKKSTQQKSTQQKSTQQKSSQTIKKNVQSKKPSQQQAQESFARKNKQQSSCHKQQTFGFKQQWQYQQDQVRKRQIPKVKKQQMKNNFSQDQVPQGLKGFLQNYQELPNYSSKINTKENKSQLMRKKHQQQLNEALGIQKQNPFTFIRTLLIVVCITIIIKVVF